MLNKKTLYCLIALERAQFKVEIIFIFERNYRKYFMNVDGLMDGYRKVTGVS